MVCTNFRKWVSFEELAFLLLMVENALLLFYITIKDSKSKDDNRAVIRKDVAFLKFLFDLNHFGTVFDKNKQVVKTT